MATDVNLGATCPRECEAADVFEESELRKSESWPFVDLPQSLSYSTLFSNPNSLSIDRIIKIEKNDNGRLDPIWEELDSSFDGMMTLDHPNIVFNIPDSGDD